MILGRRLPDKTFLGNRFLVLHWLPTAARKPLDRKSLLYAVGRKEGTKCLCIGGPEIKERNVSVGRKWRNKMSLLYRWAGKEGTKYRFCIGGPEKKEQKKETKCRLRQNGLRPTLLQHDFSKLTARTEIDWNLKEADSQSWSCLVGKASQQYRQASTNGSDNSYQYRHYSDDRNDIILIVSVITIILVLIIVMIVPNSISNVNNNDTNISLMDNFNSDEQWSWW